MNDDLALRLVKDIELLNEKLDELIEAQEEIADEIKNVAACIPY